MMVSCKLANNPILTVCCCLILSPFSRSVLADSPAPPSIPKHIQEIAQLPFENGYPTSATSRTLEDEIFFQRAVQVYLWALPAMNMYGMKEGTEKHFGKGYNVMSIYKDRLDANTIITTPNSDVIYGIGFLDLAKDGPIVLDVPPNLQALIDDMWHRAIEGPTVEGKKYLADIGLPGPDKGKGGKYLILPPDYKGEIPEEDYYIYHCRTNGVFVFLRGFFDDPNQLDEAVENMEKIRIYPYGKAENAKSMAFPNASGKPVNMLPPKGLDYFEMLDRFVQNEVADPVDHYMRGMMATLGIVKGKTFNPDEHEKALLNAASVTGWKMAKVIAYDIFDQLPKAKWYADRQWTSHPRGGGDDFYSSFTDVNWQSKEYGYTDLDTLTHMYINAYSISPGMITSIPGVGSKYLEAVRDADGDFLQGDKQYTLTLPANPPANNFWSITAYDAVTAAGLDNGQSFPSLGSRDNPQKNDDGSITLYFGPKSPKGKEKNWIKTVPGKGWFVLLRLYGPEKPFFEKQWIPNDFQKANE